MTPRQPNLSQMAAGEDEAKSPFPVLDALDGTAFSVLLPTASRYPSPQLSAPGLLRHTLLKRSALLNAHPSYCPPGDARRESCLPIPRTACQRWGS